MKWGGYTFIVVELLLTIIVLLGGAIAYFIIRIFSDVDSIKKELKPMSPAIVEIQDKLTSTGHKILFPITVTNNSPMKLTEVGEKLMKDSGFDKVISDNKKYFVDKVKEKKPKNNYDIQQSSMALIHELLTTNDPKLTPVKTYAYEEGVPVEIFVQPAGITLRDAVMESLKFDV